MRKKEKRWCDYWCVVELANLKGAFKLKGDRYYLDVEVKPGSSKSGLTGFDGWRNRFILNVKAPAIKGKANKEVLEVVSTTLGVEDVVIESGHTGRSKTVSFKVTDVENVLERLGSLLS